MSTYRFVIQHMIGEPITAHERYAFKLPVATSNNLEPVLWNGVTVCFAAIKLVIVLTWFL